MTPPRTSAAGSVVVSTFRQRQRGGRVTFRRGEKVREHLRPRPARVARMLALAHHFDAAIRSGTLDGPRDAGRRIGITESRVTQLLTLLTLAPDIQEDVLFLEVAVGRQPFTESKLRKVARVKSWSEQRRLYARLRPGFEPLHRP